MIRDISCTEILGVDIGGPIIGPTEGHYMTAPIVSGAFDALRMLRKQRFGRKIFLVSKCSEKGQEKALHQLEHHNFYDLTGIGRDHVYFCRERYEKAGICKKLGITHFIDDRLEVLSYLDMVKFLYLFRPSQDEMTKFPSVLCRVRRVDVWQEILTDLLCSQ